ncbi:MAG: hypothetical protein ABJI96_22810 [Paracoccaceae bacterium]
MKKLMIMSLAVSLALAATGSSAQSEKELDCGYQADVVDAVKNARMEGVSERKLQKTIEASDPPWPARYSKAIPVLAPYVYAIKKRDLREIDLRSEWLGTCMNN